jgi:hypothetical protein
LSDASSGGRGDPRHVACRRGLLVSVEGISGVGKTYLTDLLGAELALTEASGLLAMKGFSQRGASAQGSLGRNLLQGLVHASGSEHFLRGGHPASETLLLLAIKSTTTKAASQHCRTVGWCSRDGAFIRLPCTSP